MSGAAVLAALGALRMGAGLVTILADPEVRAEIAVQVPEAMVRAWNGTIPGDADVLLVGPGGVSDIPAWKGAMVLDASALREGEGPRWMARPRTVITPHPGEFRRLFGTDRLEAEDNDGRLAQIRAVATGAGVLVLKGHQTLVAGGADSSVFIIPSGHSGLSTGGSGDFLAGMIAGWLGRFKDEAEGEGDLAFDDFKRKVGEAVWLHGAAADRLGPGPLLVRELGASLAELLREKFKVWDGDWRPLSER
jgi:NAD(P)H-hydrate epimerase